jgi:hypothetical protein
MPAAARRIEQLVRRLRQRLQRHLAGRRRLAPERRETLANLVQKFPPLRGMHVRSETAHYPLRDGVVCISVFAVGILTGGLPEQVRAPLVKHRQLQLKRHAQGPAVHRHPLGEPLQSAPGGKPAGDQDGPGKKYAAGPEHHQGPNAHRRNARPPGLHRIGSLQGLLFSHRISVSAYSSRERYDIQRLRQGGRSLAG